MLRGECLGGPRSTVVGPWIAGVDRLSDAAQGDPDVVVVGREVLAGDAPLDTDAVEDHQDLDEPLGDR